MIYVFLIQQAEVEKIETRKRRSRLAVNGSSPALLAPLMKVSWQVQQETVYALRRYRPTFRRVVLITWNSTDALSELSATALPRRDKECPYGPNCEVQVDLYPVQHSPPIITMDEVCFQLGFVIQVLLHCHKNRLLYRQHRQPEEPNYSLSVLHRPSGSADNSEVNNATLKCTFEGNGSLVYSTSVNGSIASRMTENITHVLKATNSSDTEL